MMAWTTNDAVEDQVNWLPGTVRRGEVKETQPIKNLLPRVSSPGDSR